MSSRRKPLATLFPAIPVVKRQTAAQSTTLSNRKIADLEKKVADLQAELAASKKRATDGEANERALQLTAENENLKARAPYPSSTVEDGRHIKHLEEQLRRANWEKEDMGTKLSAENQARTQLIPKLRKLDEEKNSLAKQLQHLQQTARSPPVESHSLQDMNNDLQRSNDFLCHENEVLKRDNADNLSKLNESNLNFKKVMEEKNRLAVEWMMTKEKLSAQLEQTEWKAAMLSEQLEFVKRNSDMWQEQSRTISEHLTRSSGGVMGMMQPSHYSPGPPFMSTTSLSVPYYPPLFPPSTTSPPAFPSTPSRRRDSATPSSGPSLIILDDLDKVKKEPAD